MIKAEKRWKEGKEEHIVRKRRHDEVVTAVQGSPQGQSTFPDFKKPQSYASSQEEAKDVSVVKRGDK